MTNLLFKGQKSTVYGNIRLYVSKKWNFKLGNEMQIPSGVY